MSRRELLNVAGSLSGCRVSAAGFNLALAQPVFRNYPFAGRRSGDPWPDSVVLWTRLAPEPLEGGGMPMANVAVSWESHRSRSELSCKRGRDRAARTEHSVT